MNTSREQNMYINYFVTDILTYVSLATKWSIKNVHTHVYFEDLEIKWE